MAVSTNNRAGSFNWFVIIVIAILSVLVGFKLGNWRSDAEIEQMLQRENRLEQTYAEVERLTRRINMLEVEIEVEKLASKDIQKGLMQAQNTIVEQKRELTFFEKIMAPEREANGVAFDTFSITELTSEGRFRFQLVLMQLQKSKRFAKGRVTLTVKGTLNKEVVEYDLVELSGLDKSSTSFSFQYFTIIEGDFFLPEGFIPDSVDVKAIFPKSKWQKYNELNDRFPWQVNT